MNANARRALVRPDFERMNLPEDFWRVKVDGVSEAQRNTVSRYLFRIEEMCAKGIGLIITGPTGVGKTAIACLAAKEARSRGFTTYFMGIWELREALRSRVSYDDDVSILDRCREVDLLVLDALSEEDAKEMFVNERVLEELVSSRRAAKRVTIITTRMSGDDLRTKMPKLFDAAVGALVLLPVTGENRRVERHKEFVREVFGGEVRK